MKLHKSEIPNRFKGQFFTLGCMSGEASNQHPDQVIQETWNNWLKEFNHLNMSQWRDAFEAWKRGFLFGKKFSRDLF